MKRIAVVLTAAALMGFTLTACKAADDEDKPAAKPAASAVMPAIAWGVCPAQAEGQPPRDARQTCGTIQVPLNYQDSGSATITVAVSKLSTAKSGGKQNFLLVNPGGPADPGLDMPGTLASSLPASVLNQYDLIGFDPRGVGHSTAQSCGLTAQTFEYFANPAADGTITANVELGKAAAQKCSTVTNLRYYNTANTARDMDRIRMALGVGKISYWGQSYGTYLGTVYATLFQDRTDKAILEGNVDPTKVWAGDAALWGKGMAERFPDAAAVAAKQSGKTVRAVTDAYLALGDRLDREPAPIPGTPAKLTGTLLRGITYGMLLHNETLPVLAQFWTAAGDLANGKLSAADSGILKQILADTPDTPGVPADNNATMFLAITCGDAAWPTDISTYQAAVTATRKAYPLSGGWPAGVPACAFWPRPAETPATVTGHGARNILLLQNRRDHATPWESALGLRAVLGNRAVFVGVDNGGHYVYHEGSASTRTTNKKRLGRQHRPRQHRGRLPHGRHTPHRRCHLRRRQVTATPKVAKHPSAVRHPKK